MTIHENARFTVSRLVTEYSYEDRKNGSNKYSYWDILATIRHAYEINALKGHEVERYCREMHCTFDEVMTA